MAIHILAVVYDGLSDKLAQSDVAVVLGNEVYDDGTPSPPLKSRLDRAAELYRNGLTVFFIVSGGRGPNGYQEAEVMQRYLVAQGVPEANIIVDNAGVNTYSTARNARRILREHGWSSVILVSSYYHLSRCKLAFARFGISPGCEVYTAHADRFEWRDCRSLPREFVAYYYYLLRPYPQE